MAAQFKLADLQNFRGGSEQFYRHSLTRLLYSEGVKYVAETAGAYWLIDKVATLQMKSAVRAEEFQVWKLRVTDDRKGTLVCEDGNDVAVYSEEISFTDFPAPGVRIWYQHGTMIVPEEY